MTTSKTILLKDIIQQGESSRKKAIQAREYLLSELKHTDLIQIDLTDSNFTPSVADELVGGIAVQIGAKDFKDHIKIINATESQYALMKHVIARRVAKKKQ